MADTTTPYAIDHTVASPVMPRDTASVTSKQIEWLGASKGVGIVLLVILHVCAQSDKELSAALVWFLRLFRMPMFFVVSGLLFSARPSAVLFEQKMRSLIVPYASYLALLCLLVSLRAAVLGRTNPFLQPGGFADILLGGEYLKGDFGVFWFMTCLLFTQLLYNALLRTWHSPRSPKLIGAVASIYVAGYLLWWVAPTLRTPLAIGVVPFGLPFLWFGNLMRDGAIRPAALRILCGAILLLALCLGQMGEHFGMDLKYAEPGPFVIGIALAIAISTLFFDLMKMVVSVARLAAICELLGAASMTILFLHQFIHLSLRTVGVRNDLVLIIAGVLLPVIFWVVAKRIPLASALFLGTARRIPLMSKRLIPA